MIWYKFMLKKYWIRILIITIVIRDVINLSNSLSVVESFRSTSGSKEPSVDEDIVINNPDTVVGFIKNNDIRLPQAT